MDICRTIVETRAAFSEYRRAGETIAIVPTMGFLHEGHMALVRAARARADRVAVSIFVNPSQFGEASDLEAYPRNEDGDLAMLQAEGADLVFIPSVKEVYPDGDQTIVEVTGLSNVLHGAVRPGHFRGVTTVVARLFNILNGDFACFGEKDYQQLQIIRRMVKDLAFPIDIVAVPTVREPDGLAMSSRNVRLTPEDRAAAPVLSRALDKAVEIASQDGETVSRLRHAIRQMIEAEPRATLRGLDIVRAETLEEIEGPLRGKIAIMLSAAFGEVLLIDQREIEP